MRRCWLILGTFLMAAPGWAALSVNEVLDQLELKEGEIKTIRFTFEQAVTFSGMTSSSIVTGEGIYQKPEKFRITKKKPIEQWTITNGKKVWIYTPSYQQVWEGKWQGWLQSVAIPKGLVPVGDFVNELRGQFDISLATPSKEDPAVCSLTAIPKDPSQTFHLELTVSTDSWLPIKTVFTSESAIIVTHVSNIVLNEEVKQDIFSFQPPKGTEIVNLN